MTDSCRKEINYFGPILAVCDRERSQSVTINCTYQKAAGAFYFLFVIGAIPVGGVKAALNSWIRNSHFMMWESQGLMDA